MRQLATTIEESTFLLEHGISADTADMFWIVSKHEAEGYPRARLCINDCGMPADTPEHEYIPAWSLSALLDVVKDSEMMLSNVFVMELDTLGIIQAGLLYTDDKFAIINGFTGATPISAVFKFIQLRLIKSDEQQ
jgi:hypothetical protein